MYSIFFLITFYLTACNHFLQPADSFLKLGIYGFGANTELLGCLGITLMFLSDTDEDFTATFRQAVKRLDVKSE